MSILTLLACLAPPAHAQLDSSFLSRLSLHGYLSFAYGISAEHPQFGIPTNGTLDYDRAAVLVRFALDSSNFLVTQVAHRDLGTEPHGPSLLMDWLFLEHRFGDNTRLRIGEEPVPIGIYNDIRYVGTLLPFYRAPYNIYGEGSYTQEVVQGVVFSQTVAPKTTFPIDLDLYAGQFSYTEFWDDTSAAAIGHNTFGGRLWIGTPVQGLRFGVSALRYDVQGGVWSSIIGHASETDWYSSLDGDFDRLFVRAEYGARDRSHDAYHIIPGYIETGVRVIHPVMIDLEYQYLHLHDRPLAGPSASYLYESDGALGINITLPTAAVLKLESHLAHGYNLDDNPTSHPPGHASQYFIASISAAF